MDANWFAAPDVYEAALAGPLQRAVPSRDLIRSGVRALCLRLHLTDGAAGALYNAGVSASDLADAFDSLITELPEEPAPLGVMARAMAYVVRTFPDVRLLRASQQLDQAVGVALVRVLSEEMFPLTGQTPDPDAPLRWAATELITFRQLQASTLQALGPDARACLADRLEQHRELMLALVPPLGAQALDDVVTRSAALLRQNPPVELAQLNAAIAKR